MIESESAQKATLCSLLQMTALGSVSLMAWQAVKLRHHAQENAFVVWISGEREPVGWSCWVPRVGGWHVPTEHRHLALEGCGCGVVVSLAVSPSRSPLLAYAQFLPLLRAHHASGRHLGVLCCAAGDESASTVRLSTTERGRRFVFHRNLKAVQATTTQS
mgnify:CR=1 FL=1